MQKLNFKSVWHNKLGNEHLSVPNELKELIDSGKMLIERESLLFPYITSKMMHMAYRVMFVCFPRTLATFPVYYQDFKKM